MTKKITGYKNKLATFGGKGLPVVFYSKCKNCGQEWDHSEYTVTAVACNIKWYDTCSECDSNQDLEND